MAAWDADMENVRKLVSDLHEQIASIVEPRERQFLSELEKGQKFTFKLFSKNQPADRRTNVGRVPYRRLLPLRLAALQIYRGKYGDAASNFKQFSMEVVDLPVAKVHARFSAAICSLATSSVRSANTSALSAKSPKPRAPAPVR
jgi:hypothetical protein